MFSTQAARKGIYLDVIQDEVFPKDVFGDSGSIRQILLNVIGNAVKFTSQGGVTLKVNVSETQSGYSVKVDVIDTGIGVSGDRTAQTFEKFQQADSRTTRKFGGIGLGLSISRQLARLMDGDIVVHSEPGNGSTFQSL